MKNPSLKWLSLFVMAFIFRLDAFAENQVFVKDVCAKTEIQQIQCSNFTLVNKILTITVKLQTPGPLADENVWVCFENPATAIPWFRLTFNGGTCATSSCDGYYTLTLFQYSYSGNPCSGQPVQNSDYAYVTSRLFNDGICKDASIQNMWWVYNSAVSPNLPYPSTTPAPDPVDVKCCNKELPATDGEISANAKVCLTKGITGSAFKVTVADYIANSLPYTTDPNCCTSCSNGKLYLYYRVNGVWNVFGLEAGCRTQLSLGGDWDYFYDLGNVNLPDGCYDVYLTTEGNIFGKVIPPSLVKQACPCCNANFTYSIHTTQPSVLNYVPNYPNPNDTYHWTFGDGDDDYGYVWQSHIYPAIGNYKLCLERKGVGGKCTVCSNICITSTENAPSGGDHGEYDPHVCDANFSMTVNTQQPNTMVFAAEHPHPGTTYTWDFGDGTTGSSVTPPPHIYSNAGTYSACLNISGPHGHCMKCLKFCVDKGQGKRQGSGSGMQSGAELQVSLSPNPVNTDLNILLSAADEGIGNIRVTDMMGKTVFARTLVVQGGENHYRIPMGQLSPGIYIVECSVGSKLTRHKISKE